MIRPNKRRFVFANFLATGHLVWGVPFEKPGDVPRITRWDEGRWPLCCGQVMSDKEVEQWIAEGLAVEVEGGRCGHRSIKAGPKLDSWLGNAWHDMTAARWVRKPA